MEGVEGKDRVSEERWVWMPNLAYQSGPWRHGLGADAGTYQCLSHLRRRLLTRMDRTIDDTGDADPLAK